MSALIFVEGIIRVAMEYKQGLVRRQQTYAITARFGVSRQAS